MLVLSRKVNERLIIGNNIELIVLGVVGDRVKFGFNAPREVPIYREELCRRSQFNAARGNSPTTLAPATSDEVLVDAKQANTGSRL